VRVAAGTFHENVSITKDDITLRGAGSGAGGTVLMPAATPTPSACLEPGSTEIHGVCVIGQIDFATEQPGRPIHDVTVRDLAIEGFSGWGVAAFNVGHLIVRHVEARGNAGYGISGFILTEVRFLDNVVMENGEPGFYIGDSPHADAVVAGNVALHNGVGSGEGFGILLRDATDGVVAPQPGGRQLRRDRRGGDRRTGSDGRLDDPAQRRHRQQRRLPAQHGGGRDGPAAVRPRDLRVGRP
jgi:hypothetical protein